MYVSVRIVLERREQHFCFGLGRSMLESARGDQLSFPAVPLAECADIALHTAIFKAVSDMEIKLLEKYVGFMFPYY
jgi:hypothetical protein